MKRLLCLVSAMNAGGAETFLMKLYRRIDRTKYQMDFCVNVPGKQFYGDEIASLGGKIFCIPSKSENVGEFRRQLSALIKKENYQYVLRITSSAMGFMDLKIAKKAGAKVCIARSSNSSDGDSVAAMLAHRLGRMLYGKYVDVKIAPSDLAARYTFGEKAFREGKVHMLRNAVDLGVYHFSAEGRARGRKEFGIGENTLLAGHVGRFSEQKNHRFLLDIFAEIRKEHADSVLLLVGAGPLEEEMRKKARMLGLSDSIIFAGIRSDIPDILSAMDVFVFPSFYEGMPNTVLEAQSTALPCVIADTLTKEAAITENVEYLSLSENAETWAKRTLSSAGKPRRDVKKIFKEHGYDIDSAADEFIRLVFNVKEV